jgi:hypothetical protein
VLDSDDRLRLLWTVPALAGTTRVAIAGSLDYAPPAKRPSWVYPLLFVAAAIVLGGVVVALRSGGSRRRPSS